MDTELTFLGTGTSQGVPIIGCRCPVCTSDDPRDKRMRASVLVRCKALTILIDAGPDFRTQMLRAGVSHLDAILLTHNHMDHTGGLDDVRALNYIDKKPAMIYCEKQVLNSLKISYSYAFAENKYPGAPEWKVKLIDERPFVVTPNNFGELIWIHDQGYCYRMPDGSLIPSGSDLVSSAYDSAGPDYPADHSTRTGNAGGAYFPAGPSGASAYPADHSIRTGNAGGADFPAGLSGASDYPADHSIRTGNASGAGCDGVRIIPIRGYHDTMPVLGFRIGDIAYITDMSSLPDDQLPKLKGLKHLTLNTVSYKPHHSHFSLEEAIELARRIDAEHCWLTHLSHTFPRHGEFMKKLPEGISPAHDGLTISD